MLQIFAAVALLAQEPELTSCAYPRGEPWTGDAACAPLECVAVEDARLDGAPDEPLPMPAFCELPCEWGVEACEAIEVWHGRPAECAQPAVDGPLTCFIPCDDDMRCPAGAECWGTDWAIHGVVEWRYACFPTGL